jgi:hypothetical protein
MTHVLLSKHCQNAVPFLCERTHLPSSACRNPSVLQAKCEANLDQLRLCVCQTWSIHSRHNCTNPHQWYPLPFMEYLMPTKEVQSLWYRVQLKKQQNLNLLPLRDTTNALKAGSKYKTCLFECTHYSFTHVRHPNSYTKISSKTHIVILKTNCIHTNILWMIVKCALLTEDFVHMPTLVANFLGGGL